MLVVQPTLIPIPKSPIEIQKRSKKGVLYILGMSELHNPNWIAIPDYLEFERSPGIAASEIGIIEALVKAQKFQLDLAAGTAGTHSLWHLVATGPNSAHYEALTPEEMRLEAQSQTQDEEIEYA